MSIYTVTGMRGFLGSALTKALELQGHTVYPYPHPEADTYYFFGSPSSNIVFDRNPDYCFSETITMFLQAVQFCKRHGIRLVYPSSATVYNKNTLYAKCKAVLESIHEAYGGDILGLRIFASYGPGEGHKKDYASVVYQWCQDMRQGLPPVIYGDGSQTRDFVFVSDVVATILNHPNTTGIIDIGTGTNTSFNQLVDYINAALGTSIEPIYKPKPREYVEETVCRHPLATHTPLISGIRRILA